MNDEKLKELCEKYRNIAIFVPTYKLCPAIFVQDFFVFVTRLFQVGFNPHFFFIDQTSVAIARNMLVKNFVPEMSKLDYKAVLWIDSDQVFMFGDFVKLLEDFDDNQPDVDVMSARYITRDPYEPKVCALNKSTRKEGYYDFISVNEEGIVEVDAFGFGFVLMKPVVLEKMWDKFGIHQFAFELVGDPQDGGMIGEDIVWCRNAQSLGYRMFLNNNVRIGHYGGVIDERAIQVLKK